MDFIIKEYTNYNEEEIINLYNSVGWVNYVKNPKMLEEAYHNSLMIYGAYVNNLLVGIIRIVGDGKSVILIQDLLVKPRYQNNGIGKKLVNTVLDSYKNVYQIHVYTDFNDKLTRFYKSFGFLIDTDINCRTLSKFNNN